jgi:hypothetical protein
MKTLYRLDFYYRNNGNFMGFYDSLDDIPYNLVPFDGEQDTETCAQVTEFTCVDSLFGQDAWESGDIVANHYYQETEF